MATFRVANFAELISANTSSADGDEILFTSSSYTSTATISFSKSLTFGLGPGISSVAITLGGSNEFRINGQTGGTIQTWNGPFVFVAGAAGIITIGNTLSGPITVTLNNVHGSGSTVTGMKVTSDGTHAINATFNDSSADSNNDGFQCTGSSNQNATLTLNRCTADSNTDDAYSSIFGNLVANNCTASNSGMSAVDVINDANGTFTDCTFSGSSASSLLRANGTGTSTYIRCSGTTGVANIIRVAVFVPASIVFKECDLSNSSNEEIILFSTAVDVSLSDCKLTQTGNFTGNNKNMISTVGSLTMRRCILDASASTGNPTTDLFLATATTGIDIRGNVFIGPETTGGNPVYLANVPSGTTKTTIVDHNTFVVKTDIAGTVHGLSLNGNRQVRGNIFSGLNTGIVTGGTSDYAYHTTSGYNVFYNNTIDMTGTADRPTDALGLVYDPFLDQTNKDFRLVADSAADKIDPLAAFQIDYHQVSVVTRGQGSVTKSLAPAIDAVDGAPTDAGAYNNANIFPVVTLTATPLEEWEFGRWDGETTSTDNPFVFTLTSSHIVTAYFFSDIVPHLTSPKGGEIFNLGKVNIAWDTNNPLALNENVLLSYEIEYTDNYVGANDTNWHSAKRRIPWNLTSYEWIVGKMIKSDTVRVRIRARHSDGSFSGWSMMSGNFAINVFKMVPPVIVSPIPFHVYTDFILIILDETLTINTFSQKVRYTLEYSSDARNVDWTVIVQDLPVGQNVIRWDLEDVITSDDYVLRLTAKNASTSCEQTSEPTPDQISRRFIYNLKIQQPGMFLIDTKPPQAILDVESSTGITSQLSQTLTIFAEDATSDVEQIQLRECNASQQLALGDVSNTATIGTTDCTPIDQLLAEPNLDFNTIIGKPLGYTAKTQWVFEDVSGLRRLEAMLTDTGGNNSLQSLQNVFIPVFRSETDVINDMIVVTETRDINEVEEDSTSGAAIVTTRLNVPFEVAYIGTQSGSYWILEPFPRLLDKLGREIRLLIEYFDVIYILSYADTKNISDTGSIYRDDKTQITNIFDFNQNARRIPNAVTIFKNIMYIGLDNGELWSFDGVTPIKINQLSNPVTTLVGDNLFLYIGQANSSEFVLYDGTEFFTSDLEP